MRLPKRLRIATRFFLSYVLLFVLPLTLAGFGYLGWNYTSAADQSMQAYEKAMVYAGEALELKFDELSEFMGSLLQKRWIELLRIRFELDGGAQLSGAQIVEYALIVATILPIVFVYPFAQKYFTQGVMIGAIKE